MIVTQNLNQNPRTLLPKFFGFYCYICNAKNVRMVVMNNLLPSSMKLHEKYDLKGSTYNRKVISYKKRDCDIQFNYCKWHILLFRLHEKKGVKPSPLSRIWISWKYILKESVWKRIHTTHWLRLSNETAVFWKASR